MKKLVAMAAAAVAIFVVVLLVTGSGGGPDPELEFAAVAPTPTATPAPTPAPTATPAPTPTPTPVQFTMSFSGDLLSHGPVIERARSNGATVGAEFDYTPMFEAVEPLVAAADLAVCHVETPISSDNTALSGYPVFNAPRELADAIASVGWDACSVASNHALDRGFAGVTATLDQLDRAGVAHSGTARTQAERDTPPIYDVAGVGVGHLSYTYGTNGIPVPADAPFSVNVTTVDAVLADAAAARAAGADFVVLSIQWGAEYRQAPTAVQLEQAEAFTASADIDLIIGAHAHVIQPVDVVNGKVVLYGLGNFVSNQSPQSCNSCPAASQDGMLFEVTVTETAPGALEVTGVHVIPTFVDRSTYQVVPVAQRLAQADTVVSADTLRASWERTHQAVYALGVDPALVTVEPLPG